MPTDYYDDATRRIADMIYGPRDADPPTPCDDPPAQDEPPAHACMVCGRTPAESHPYIIAASIEDDELRTTRWVCDEHEELAHCAGCGELVSTRHATHPNDAWYCDECTTQYLADGIFGECYDCGRIIANNQLTYIDGSDSYVCRPCRRNYYGQCNNCGDWHHQDGLSYDDDSGHHYCDSCYEESACGIIGSYHGQDKVRQFLGEGAYHHGLEIEVECSRDHANAARECQELWPDNAVTFERDGSLSDGFEVITDSPWTTDYLRSHRGQVTEALASLVANGCRSHNTSSCGMHIHTSWPALGVLKAEQDYNSTKLALITERFPEDMDKLCRRRATSYCPKINSTEPVYIEAMKGNIRGAWNFQERDTFEFRHPRGTLNVDTVYATVELVDALVRSATRLSIERIQKAKTLAEVLRAANGGRIRAELAAYMERRGVATDTAQAAPEQTEPENSPEDAIAEPVARW